MERASGRDSSMGGVLEKAQGHGAKSRYLPLLHPPINPLGDNRQLISTFPHPLSRWTKWAGMLLSTSTETLAERSLVLRQGQRVPRIPSETTRPSSFGGPPNCLRHKFLSKCTVNPLGILRLTANFHLRFLGGDLYLPVRLKSKKV